MARITVKEVEDYKVFRKKEVKPSTVNRELACIKHMFTKAIEWGVTARNAVKSVKLFRESPGRLRFLTAEEIDQVLKAASMHLKSILVTALNTGMRREELFNLKWEDVDFRTGQITVADSKNGEKRYIPMNATLRETLSVLPRHFKSSYVFCKKDGKQYTDIKRAFQTSLKKAKIEDFRFHDLRHTFASQLVMKGADLVTVKELLGHKTIKMTLRYSHLSADHKQRTVNSLDVPDRHQYGHQRVSGKEGAL